jgi:hypothetical protein
LRHRSEVQIQKVVHPKTHRLDNAMYARNFRRAAQTRRFSITDTGSSGWEVREEQNSLVVRIVRYDDWHRVERALLHFTREAVALRDSGWIEA